MQKGKDGKVEESRDDTKSWGFWTAKVADKVHDLGQSDVARICNLLTFIDDI